MEHIPSMRDKSKSATLRSTGSLSDSPQSSRRISYAHLASQVRASTCWVVPAISPAFATPSGDVLSRSAQTLVSGFQQNLTRARSAQGNTNTSIYSISPGNTNTNGSLASDDSTPEGEQPP